MTTVRIGIVSWNTAELLDACLAALPAAAEGIDFDVVVVDNQSADESVAAARRHGAVTVIANEENVGYARAMNQALTLPGLGPPPEVLVALNPDTVPSPRSIARLVEHLLADPAVGLVVPRLVNTDGSLQHSVFRYPSSVITAIICTVPIRLQRGRLARRWWLDGRAPHAEATDIDWAIGAVHVIRASALHGELPYGERWFMYVEDVDLCWRLSEAGWRCRLEPDAEVLHVGNASGQQAWGAQRSQRWWGATYDWYRFRHGAPAARRWATVNTIGVASMLARARLRHRVLGRRANPMTASQIVELRAILPLHVAMARGPRTAFLPDERGHVAPPAGQLPTPPPKRSGR